jgi:flagellar basal-body rod modification protein FlgD
MNVTASSNVTTGTAANQTPAKKQLTQEDFMSLLLAQMKFQDPLNPMDNYQMAAQMAQLSTVNGINKLTEQMEAMSTYQASAAHLQAAGLIGKKVEALGNRMTVQNGKGEGSYQLTSAGRVAIEIYDGKGNPVKTIEAGQKGAGNQSFTWDGKDLSGRNLPDGTYTFSVKAVDAKGAAIAVSPFMVGVVSGITFENGMTYISIGSEKIMLSDIFGILS